MKALPSSRSYGVQCLTRQVEVPPGMADLKKCFKTSLELASAKQPLVVFLDGIDRLDDVYGGSTHARTHTRTRTLHTINTSQSLRL